MVDEKQYAYDAIKEGISYPRNEASRKLLNLFEWYELKEPDKLEDFKLIVATHLGEDNYKHLEVIMYGSDQAAMHAYNAVIPELMYYLTDIFGYNTDEVEDIFSWGSFDFD